MCDCKAGIELTEVIGIVKPGAGDENKAITECRHGGTIRYLLLHGVVDVVAEVISGNVECSGGGILKLYPVFVFATEVPVGVIGKAKFIEDRLCAQRRSRQQDN